MNKRIKTLKIALARITKLSEKLEDIVNWETENLEVAKNHLIMKIRFLALDME